MDERELENAFTYHPPSITQAPKFIRIRDAAKDLAWLFTKLCPPSRELSLAITKLRESAMWAAAAIACNQERAEEMDEKALRARQQIPAPDSLEATRGE
jgi:hypothetical protein